MAEADHRILSLRLRFVAQTLELMPSIEMSAASRDWPSLVATAHSLAGRAGMFGFPGLGDAARDVEESIEAGADDDAIEKLCSKLLEAVKSLHQVF